MKFRTQVVAYFILVGACIGFLAWSLAFGPGGPYDSIWAFLAWLLLTVVTFPWSLIIVFVTIFVAIGRAIVDGPLIGDLYPGVAIALLLHFGAAAVNVFIAKRRRDSRAKQIAVEDGA